jgi:hypothetical protein
MGDEREFEDGGQRFELVMPFVVVTSKGGPYDDAAFVAGWECAVIDRALGAVAEYEATFRRTVHSANLPQLDLIAMKHGYAMEGLELDVDAKLADPAGEWSWVSFAPMDPP